MLLLAPGYQLNTTPWRSRIGPVEPDGYDVFVLKSRVHFRRGFDETGYAKTIHIVDTPGDWFETIRLDALEYENIDVKITIRLVIRNMILQNSKTQISHLS